MFLTIFNPKKLWNSQGNTCDGLKLRYIAIKVQGIQLTWLLRNVFLKNLRFHNSRSSHHRCSMKKVLVKNLAKFTGKHLCRSFFFYKEASLRPKKTLAQFFFCEFSEIFKTPTLKNICERLLLIISLEDGTREKAVLKISQRLESCVLVREHVNVNKSNFLLSMARDQ